MSRIPSMAKRIAESYIVATQKHYVSKYNIPDEATRYFDNIYQQQLEEINARAAKSAMKPIENSIKQNGHILSDVDGLISDLNGVEFATTLSDTLAKTLETQIANSLKSADKYILDAKSEKYQRMLQTDNVDLRLLKGFFSDVQRVALELGGFTADQLDALEALGVRIAKAGGKSFSLNRIGQLAAVNQVQIEQLDKVIKQLTNAVDKYENSAVGGKANYLTSRSFSTTINNIFSRVMGEQISASAVAAAGNTRNKAVTKAVKDAVKGLKNVKVVEATMGNEFDMTGTARDATNRVSTVDAGNNLRITMKVRQSSGQMETVTFEVPFNLTIKWYKPDKNGRISPISLIHKTPFRKYFQKFSKERFYAYNIITFRRFDKNSDAYKALRASVSIKEFDAWISGSGAALTTGGYNKAQYLIINKHIYSIADIIRRVGQIARISATDSGLPINMGVNALPIRANIWKEPDYPNWPSAWDRSGSVNEMIDRLVITAHFNPRMLNI